MISCQEVVCWGAHIAQGTRVAAALQRYIQHMQGLGAALLHGIAMGLQLPPDTFLGGFAGQEGSYWVSTG
jgi:isopenicillin N synthase-like dioxygenase